MKSRPQVVLVHPAAEINAVCYRMPFYIKSKLARNLVLVGKYEYRPLCRHLFINLCDIRLRALSSREAWMSGPVLQEG